AVPPPPATPATEPPRPSRPKISRDGCDASGSRNPDRKNSLDATFVRPNLARSPESHKTGQQGLINQRFPSRAWEGKRPPVGARTGSGASAGLGSRSGEANPLVREQFGRRG